MHPSPRQVIPADTHQLTSIAGMTCATVSISAGEGRNALLRNMLGKVAANLNLLQQLDPQPEGATPFELVDVFTDEGHRIGAYYLVR